jgi:hypothetical protein
MDSFGYHRCAQCDEEYVFMEGSRCARCLGLECLPPNDADEVNEEESLSDSLDYPAAA